MALVFDLAGTAAANASDASTPQTLSREGGQVSLRANRIDEGGIKVDGRLDEAIYSQFEPASDFIQQEPQEGALATERTQAWVFFDAKNVYVSARCWDSQPDRMVANEMRRDHFNLFENENFGVILDTFHDRRNGYFFYTTPLGGLQDSLVTDEGNSNRDWNTVWDAKVSRDDKGWSVEFVIPFKSLRFASEGPWGINLRRRVRWKNEISHLTAIPASFGRRGLMKLSSAADLLGISTPASSRAFEIKPYATGGLSTDNELPEPNQRSREVGFDGKVTLSSALALDLTYNTDFAQVEDDLQQVNLSRFSVFFPEKRDFFLEGQGIFGLGNQGGFGPARTPILFFSRRIGLSEDQLVPIVGGGRLTGKLGGWSVGALQMRTGRDLVNGFERSDFSVLRVKRDILKRSNLGAILTRRDDAGSPANLVYAGDINLSLKSTMKVTAIGARAEVGGGSARDRFYLGNFDWSADRYGFEVERFRVEENFDPGIGFVPRSDIERSEIRARFSPRPASDIFRSVRKFGWSAGFDTTNTVSTGARESQQIEGRFVTEFQSGDEFSIQVSRNLEAVAEEFEVAGELIVPVGSYRFTEIEVQYQMGQQRKLAGSLGFQHGGFYGGTRTEFQYSRGRIEISSRLSVEPQILVNRIETPFGNVTTRLISGRANWTLTPRMLVSLLSQYNSTTNQLTNNLRFRWEYQPGSDFFVVYGDSRDTLSTSRIPAIDTRSFAVKFTRLFRF